MSQPTRRQPDRTRQALLDSAFDEIHRSGFRSASLDSILETAGVTKGALYHHFRNKAELGYAVVDEVVRPWVEGKWVPTLEADNCIDAALQVIADSLAQRSETALTYGCPFNNLCQEMSPVDEGFRERLTAILLEWQAGLAASIRKGQANGAVRQDVNAEATATFIVSCIEGCLGMAKAAQSREFLEAGFQGLIEYLEHLRA